MDDIKVKQKVKLFFEDNSGQIVELSSEIKEVFDDRLSINVTDEILKYTMYLNEGEELTAKVFTPLGVKILSSIILDSPLEENFVIELPEQVDNEIQRRQYARVPYSAKIVLKRGENTIISNTIDISGGGLRFSSLDPFVKGEIIEGTLYFPDVKMIQFSAKIVTNDFLPKNIQVLTFVDIAELDRDIIIKKGFEAQTKLLEVE